MGLEIKTILLAMTPINELRGTIPIALGIWNLGILKTFFFSVLGNMIPVFFLLWFWPHLADFFMRKSKMIKSLLDWVFKRTYKRFYEKYSLYGNLALIILVAIPFPFTGAWTGTIASFLFKIPYYKGLGLIFLGVLIAGLIVTLGTLGFISLI